MAVQTRTGAPRDRRATERRTHYPTRRWHARSRCKEPLKHGTAPFDAHPYLCDVTAAPRRRSPAPPPPAAASSARPASNALRGKGRAVLGSQIIGVAPTPTRTAHAPAALRTRAPTGLARPEMAVQTRTGAARDRRATERRTHYPTRR